MQDTKSDINFTTCNKAYPQVWLLETTLLDKLAPFEVLWDSTGPLGVPRDVLSLSLFPLLLLLVLFGLVRAMACGVDSFEKVPLTWFSSWSRTACIPSISSSSWNTNSLSSTEGWKCRKRERERVHTAWVNTLMTCSPTILRSFDILVKFYLEWDFCFKLCHAALRDLLSQVLVLLYQASTLCHELLTSHTGMA